MHIFDRTIQVNRLSFNVIISSLTLFICGLLMITSAACEKGEYFFIRQLIFIVLGLAGILGLQKIPMRILWALTPHLYGIAILCILLLLTPLGIEANGACRWLNIAGIFQLQVAEVVKVAVIFFVSYMIYRYPTQVRNPVFTIYLWLAGGIPAALLLWISSDLSSSMVVLGITFLMSFLYTRTPKFHFVMAFLAVVFAAGIVYYVSQNMPDPNKIGEDYRLLRIAAWIDPERYKSGAAFQSIHAKMAIKSGGFLGMGIGRSIQKWGNLPEAHTDFIFSIICEELGAIGASIAIFIYVLLLYNIMKIGCRTERLFENALVIGIFFHLALQILFNLGVNLSILPNTGLPLPFLSYGGTSAAIVLMEMGVILKIQHRNIIGGYRHG